MLCSIGSICGLRTTVALDSPDLAILIIKHPACCILTATSNYFIFSSDVFLGVLDIATYYPFNP